MIIIDYSKGKYFVWCRMYLVMVQWLHSTQWGEVLSEGPILITFDSTIHSTDFYRMFHESPNVQAVNILRFLKTIYFSEDSTSQKIHRRKIQRQIVSSFVQKMNKKVCLISTSRQAATEIRTIFVHFSEDMRTRKFSYEFSHHLFLPIFKNC